MEIRLNQGARKWQRIGRDFADEYLQPHEVEAELNNGELAPDIAKRNKARALELGFPGLDAPQSHGGLGLTMVGLAVALAAPPTEPVAMPRRAMLAVAA